MAELKKPYIDESLTNIFILQNLVLSEHYVQQHNYADYKSKQFHLGSRLLKYEIPKTLEACSLPAEELFQALSKEHPLLWERLLGPSAFGYTQGELFFELRGGGDTDLKQEIAKNAAIFFTFIALFDHILDETPTGSGLFRDVTVGFLQDLMDLSRNPSPDTLGRKLDSANAMERLLLALITAFFMSCRCLYQQKRNEKTWNELSSSILRMYEAEKKCSGLKPDEILYDTQQLYDLKCKSAMPITTVSLISKLTFDEDSEQDPRIEKIFDSLGSILWLVDDLSDFVKDLNAGAPNYILAKMKSIQSEESTRNQKWHIREAISLTIKDLFTLLDNLNEDLNYISIQDETRRDMLEFAHMTVNIWLIE